MPPSFQLSKVGSYLLVPFHRWGDWGIAGIWTQAFWLTFRALSTWQSVFGWGCIKTFIEHRLCARCCHHVGVRAVVTQVMLLIFYRGNILSFTWNLICQRREDQAVPGVQWGNLPACGPYKVNSPHRNQKDLLKPVGPYHSLPQRPANAPITPGIRSQALCFRSNLSLIQTHSAGRVSRGHSDWLSSWHPHNLQVLKVCCFGLLKPRAPTSSYLRPRYGTKSQEKGTPGHRTWKGLFLRWGISSFREFHQNNQYTVGIRYIWQSKVNCCYFWD